MSEDIRKRVIEIVDQKRDEIVKFAQELVRTPSVTGNEAAVQKITAHKLEKLGLEMDIFNLNIKILSKHPGFIPLEEYRKSYEGRPNVVGTLKGTGGGRPLILMGHVDTVPVEDKSKWKHGPWGAEIENGRLYGRGAFDMKGGVAAINMALECILEAGASLKGDVIIENVIEEEAGGNGAIACAQRGYRADAGIIAEPSGFAIAISNRGAQYFRITVPGEAGLLEVKWGSPNAIEKAMYIYDAVDKFSLMRQKEVTHLPSYKFYDFKPEEIPDPTLAALARMFVENVAPLGICKIKAGKWPSSLPDECVMEGSIECLPDEDIKAVRERFKEYIERVARADPWLREHPPKVEWFGLWLESCLTDPEHPIIPTLKKNYNEVTGFEPIVIGGGGSDLRCLTKYAETPAVVFGGGTGEGAHGIDEYVEIDSLIDSTKTIALTILDWCS